jgi:AmmeMemoRadiSam system protein B
MELRQPAVAGRFYPGDAESLGREVASYLGLASEPPLRARAVVVPHAGYIYSGAIAGQTLGAVEAPRSAIVICPNHTGQGPTVSLYARGGWRVPTGTLAVDVDLADRVRERTGAAPDERAHRGEHAIEVELPFLLAKNPAMTIVPICLGHVSLDACRALGRGIADALAEAGRADDTLIVASTDMSHYLEASRARELDMLAIDRVSELDPEGLYQVVEQRRISMCGFIPTTVALFAAKTLGARASRLVRYGNSGERSGDFSRVVGYAGFVLS